MRKNRVDVITLGCSKNLIDSERLMQQFVSNGYAVYHDAEKVSGEIVVVNTCGFIGDAKEESINMILSLAEHKRVGRIGRLYVMGCLSERYREELAKEIPEVDAFYGKFDWKQLINDLGKAYYSDELNGRILTTPKHYAYLKISEGCNRKCAYCAIPIITGAHESRPMSEILKEATELHKRGVRELQLVAQDLTYYGLDSDVHLHQLPMLVEKLADITGIEWIRLHYAYPQHFPMDLLRVMRERPNVCKYLDIALQHISNPMLSAMRRGITKEQTYDLIRKIREEVPGIHIRTTLMTGFPGETDQDFEELLQFVRDVRFERMGAFVYSHEENTHAAKTMKDDVPSEVKQARLESLMAVQESIAAEINAQKVGQVLRVIIDRQDGEFFVGRTEFDSPDVDGEVLINRHDAPSLLIGQFYAIRITGAEAFDLYGHPQEDLTNIIL